MSFPPFGGPPGYPPYPRLKPSSRHGPRPRSNQIYLPGVAPYPVGYPQDIPTVPTAPPYNPPYQQPQQYAQQPQQFIQQPQQYVQQQFQQYTQQHQQYSQQSSQYSQQPQQHPQQISYTDQEQYTNPNQPPPPQYSPQQSNAYAPQQVTFDQSFGSNQQGTRYSSQQQPVRSIVIAQQEDVGTGLKDAVEEEAVESGPTTTPSLGTVQPWPNFDPNQDCQDLKKAMKGVGCNTRAIINIICRRSNEQRQKIREQFKTMYGKNLMKELQSVLSGKVQDTIISLMYTPDEYDARELYTAMKGLGTNEKTLIEILVSRTNDEINAIKEKFRKMYKGELEQWIMDDTSFNFKHLLVSLTNGSRDESTHTDPAKAALQAKQLYDAGEKRWGTEESVFNAIMVATNPYQLQLIMDEYRKLTGHEIEKAIKSEFSGDIKDGLLAIVKCTWNKPVFFAERAMKFMKGLGTNDRVLIRVIVSRSEIDMVQIKEEFQRLYQKTLGNWIIDDTSGKYRDALLMIIGDIPENTVV